MRLTQCFSAQPISLRHNDSGRPKAAAVERPVPALAQGLDKAQGLVITIWLTVFWLAS